MPSATRNYDNASLQSRTFMDKSGITDANCPSLNSTQVGTFPTVLQELAIHKADLEARKATMRDIPAILQLINSYAAEGIMLPRTEFEMSENIRDFSVVYAGTRLLGCGALHYYTPTSGEIRSLAVASDAKRHGIGAFLTEALELEAIENGLNEIFAFTYVADFFRKLGFHEVDRGRLPLKVWKDCLSCPKFQCCDEIAVIKELSPFHTPCTTVNLSDELVQLPVLSAR